MYCNRQTNLLAFFCIVHKVPNISIYVVGRANICREKLGYGQIWIVPLACIHIDIRNIFLLIIASGHHWERDGDGQKPEPLDN